MLVLSFLLAVLLPESIIVGARVRKCCTVSPCGSRIPPAGSGAGDQAPSPRPMAREHPRGFLSVERVKERLSLLRDAGVQGMYFSVDAFHQEFVRAECVCRGIRFAREIFGDDSH